MGDYSVLIGAIFGFGASITPDMIALFQAHMQHRYALKEKEIELEAAMVNHKFALATTEAKSSTKELEALLTHDSSLKGNWFIEGMRASVRPVVTYVFVLLFMAVKISILIQMLWYEQTALIIAVPLLWDSDTMSLFAAILSFWFGARSMQQFRATIPNRVTPTPPTSTPRYRRNRR